MKNIDWREVLTTILIGAAVAFLTSLVESLQQLLMGNFPEVVGSTVAMAKHALRRYI